MSEFRRKTWYFKESVPFRDLLALGIFATRSALGNGWAVVNLNITTLVLILRRGGSLSSDVFPHGLFGHLRSVTTT